MFVGWSQPPDRGSPFGISCTRKYDGWIAVSIAGTRRHRVHNMARWSRKGDHGGPCRLFFLFFLFFSFLWYNIRVYFYWRLNPITCWSPTYGDWSLRSSDMLLWGLQWFTGACSNSSTSGYVTAWHEMTFFSRTTVRMWKGFESSLLGWPSARLKWLFPCLEPCACFFDRRKGLEDTNLKTECWVSKTDAAVASFCMKNRCRLKFCVHLFVPGFDILKGLYNVMGQ